MNSPFKATTINLKQKSLNFPAVFIILSIFCLTPCFAREQADENKIAGEFFGLPVPVENYYFAKRVVLSLEAPWRGVPRTEEEVEDLTWQELLFSYEAFKRGIEATDQEVNNEIDKMLKAEKVEFNWREDTEEFKKWAEERLKASVELFKNEVVHLIKLKKLRQQVIDSMEVEVGEEEAYHKFLDEYNSLGVQIIQFEDSQLQEAEELYQKVKARSKLWEREEKKKQDSFRDLKGPYALDFLINLWGFKREDAYAMMDMQVGEFYKPSPIYKGYAVFKITAIRKADPGEFDKKKDYYFDKVKTMKKYQGYGNWVKELKQQAEIKVFIK